MTSYGSTDVNRGALGRGTLILVGIVLGMVLLVGGMGIVAAEDPEPISDWDDLNETRNDLGGDYILVSDLDEETDGYDGIGDDWDPILDFDGKFDGDGHTISDLVIDQSDSGATPVGLFGRVGSNGEILNVVLLDASVTGDEDEDTDWVDTQSPREGGDRTGALVGILEGTVNNSGVEADVVGGSRTGGLVGTNRGQIVESYAIGTVEGNSKVGGLVGWNDARISKSYAKVQVNADGKRSGGLVGVNGRNDHQVPSAEWVNESYATGDVSGSSSIGGLIGLNRANVVSSYSTGNVSGDSQLAGFIGQQASPLLGAYIEDSYSIGAVSGDEDLGGFTVSKGLDASVYDSYWDIEAAGLSFSGEGTGLRTAEMTGDRAEDNMFAFGETWEGQADETAGEYVVFYPVLSNNTQDPAPSKTLFEAGDGSEVDPYVITSVSELQTMELDLSAHYVLGSNISASDTENWDNGFDPIGSDSEPFTGTFDGDGHSITGLFIDRNVDDVGLFGAIGNSGEVQRVGLIDADITGNSSVGGLAGLNNGEVTESYVTGSITGDSNVGALVGVNDGPISDSYTTGNVTATADSAGGLVGSNDGVVSTSYAVGNVTSASNAGGLVGVNDGIVSTSYWNEIASGLEDGVGNNTNSFDAIGLTTADMKGDAAIDNMDDFDFPDTWDVREDAFIAYPFLVNNTQLPDPGLEALFPGGDGSADDPYQVETWKHLDIIRYVLDAHIVLNNDLESESPGYASFVTGSVEGFEPIGNTSDPFTGAFDGNGHTIADLSIDRNSDEIGLFGAIGAQGSSSGELKDVSIIDADISGNDDVGGLVGTNDGGTVIRVSTTGVVTGDNQVGGIAGSSSGDVTESFSTVEVTATGTSAGGLVGLTEDGSISDSYATGNIEGDEAVGGLIGEHEASVERSFAVGPVQGLTDVGGLIGSSTGAVDDSYWDLNTTNQDTSDGGDGLATSHMKGPVAADTMFDFVGTWSVSTGKFVSYPGLQAKPQVPAPGFGTVPFEGDGSVVAPYQIEHWQHLDAVRFDRDARYELTTDLDDDAPGYSYFVDDPSAGFDPVSNDSNPFTGTFDGGGHTIEHVEIDRPDLDEIGLFGVNDGTIERVSLVSVDVTGDRPVGALVGENRGTVTEVSASGSVTGERRVGGVIGENDGEVSVAYADVSVSGTDWVGGLVGRNNGGTISRTYAVGDVDGADEVGGLVGRHDIIGEISESYATGSVTATDGDAGGLVGDLRGDLVDSYWDVDTTDDQNGIGTGSGTFDAEGLTTREMKAPKAPDEMQSFDFASDWEVVEDSEDGYMISYPFLRSVPQDPAPGTDTLFSGGNGTVDAPYELGAWDELYSAREVLDGNYTVVSDIDDHSSGYQRYVSDPIAGFDPIGDATDPFTGTFDGDGHTISTLTIDRHDENHVGLFGVAQGDIENVSLVDVDVHGLQNVGGLVGRLDDGNVSNASVSGEVSGDGDLVGGLVGESSDSPIYTSSTDVNVTGSADVGGLAGSVSDGTVTDSHTDGNVTGQNAVGGLVGHLSTVHVRNSSVTGEITGDGYYSGGLAGNVTDSTLDNSSVHGAVTGDSAVGGLVGSIDNSTVSESYADGDVAGSTSIGGVAGGSGNDSTISNTYSISDVSGTGEHVGGLVGSNIDSAIDWSYAAGHVDGTDRVGGLVGSNEGFSSVYDSVYWAIDETGQQTGVGKDSATTPISFDGVGLQAPEMKGNNSFDTMDGLFSFENDAWNVTDDPSNGYTASYPYLERNAQDPEPGVTQLFSDGDGVQSDGYWVESWEQLHNVRGALDADISIDWEGDFSNQGSGYDTYVSEPDGGFVPIGTEDRPFTGNFSSPGESSAEIADLNIDREDEFVGLFGYVDSASIMGISLTDADISSDNDTVGGVSGYANASEFVGVGVNGTVEGLDQVGGLVGDANASEFRAVDADGTVKGVDRVGGLLGVAQHGTDVGGEDPFGVIVASSSATTVLAAGVEAGGAVGMLKNSTVEYVDTSGAVEADENTAGGVVGNASVGSQIANSSASGDVTGEADVGGVVGSVEDNSTVTNATATGSINGTDGDRIGGLAGTVDTGSLVDDGTATGNVSSIGRDVGGLAGAVIGTSTVRNSNATGTVTGYADVGGLAGDVSGGSTIANSSGTGVVNGTGGDNVGGFVGQVADTSTIEYSNATGDVSSIGDDVGGLVGELGGNSTIQRSDAAGDVIGEANGVGGLVGNFDNGTILLSFATGDVETTGGTHSGGFVGKFDEGSIDESFAIGNVTGPSTEHHVGGLVGGGNDGTGDINRSYATGSVFGGEQVGGLVGTLDTDMTVTASYATGTVTGESSVGGLIGHLDGAVTESYWDTDTTNQSDGYATGSGTFDGSGLTSFEMKGSVAGENMDSFDFGSVWDVYDDPDDGRWIAYPHLVNHSYSTDGKPLYPGFTQLFAGGNGTVDQPYEIQDWEQLHNVRANISENFVLGNDLNESSSGWESYVYEPEGHFSPIGDVTDPFTGTLDGSGHTIDGVRIVRPDENFVGLVGILEDGTIEDVSLTNTGPINGSNVVGGLVGKNDDGKLVDVQVSSSGEPVEGLNRVGGLVGDNRGSIENASATTDVTGASTLGGLVGTNDGGTVENARAGGTVVGSNDEIGGLVGTNDGGNVTRSFATGDVGGDTASVVGGFVGWNERGDIAQSYATGDVEGQDEVGGLVGWNDGASVTESFAAGSVSGTGASVGGVVGDNDGDVTEAAFDLNVTGQGNAYGTNDGSVTATALTTIEMKGAIVETTLDAFDFIDTWGAVTGDAVSYPYLVDNHQVDEPGLESVTDIEVSVAESAFAHVDEAEFVQNETVAFTAEVSLAETGVWSITKEHTVAPGEFAVGDETVATVDEQGTLYGVSTGETTLTTSYESVSTDFSFTITAGPADSIGIETQPNEEQTAGDPITGPPAVNVTDEFGNGVEAVEVTVELLNGSFASGDTTVETDSDGIATFDDLNITSVGDAYELNFSIDQAAVNVDTSGYVHSETVTVSPADPAVLQVVDTTAPIDAGDELQISITVTDEFTNPIVDTQVENVFVTALLDGPLLEDIEVTLDETGSGTIDIPAETIQTSDTNYEIDVQKTTNPSVFGDTVTITVNPGEAESLTIETQPDENQTAGETITGPPAVTVTDAYDNRVPAGTVTVTAIDGTDSITAGETTVPANATGIATFDDLEIETADDYKFVFSIDDADELVGENVSTPTGPFTVLPAATARVDLDPDDNQTITAGGTLDINASAFDEFDNLVTDNSSAFTWQNASSTGIFENTSAGSYGISATHEAVDSPTVLVTVEPALATTIDIHRQPATTQTAGAAITGPPQALVTDDHDNPIEAVTVTVSVTAIDGAGTITGGDTTAETNSTGIAVFDDLQIEAVGHYTLSFDADGVPQNATADSFTISAAGADSVAVEVQPENTTAGDVIGGPPTFLVSDQFGNPLDDHDVTVHINASPFADGTTNATTTNTSGRAVFDDLVVDNPGVYTLTVDGKDFAENVTTDAFTIDAVPSSPSPPPSPSPSPSPSPDEDEDEDEDVGAETTVQARDDPDEVADETRSNVTVTAAKAGETVRIDRESTGQNRSLAGLENINVDGLSIEMATDRDFSLNVSTYERDSPGVQLDPETSASMARFERETGSSAAGYVQFDHDLEPDDVSNATFEFTIRTAYLEELDIEPAQVNLYRFADDEWGAIPTTYVDDDDMHAHFEATSPGFSTFAIGTDTARFEVIDWELNVPEIDLGEDVSLTAVVENHGRSDGEYIAQLNADGEEVAIENIQIAAGDSVSLTITFTPDGAGVYELSLGDVEVGSVTISEVDDDTGEAHDEDQTVDGDYPEDEGIGTLTTLLIVFLLFSTLIGGSYVLNIENRLQG